ncbi:NAD(P)-dependent oxidoreductase [Ramlibacter ginsenosidimutans]|uniref:NAD(P)-dependent oxidoreductase n=1 Tax=Ramlibacter ginsenosidimutans TaxID=502333 RepID=A0A934TRZ2_9BURK|nr:NAD(P)-dependent oxidoreductase [Ramlibacter ginsenosidimutans]MBK6006324.1 NAD(P)-dependent oxidoreductase [Ramlibacter ginsenosidimutans]
MTQPFGKNDPIGFIGLGVMGKGMALCLRRAGHALHVFARSDAPAQALVAAGAQRAASPAEVGRASRLVFLCVSDDAAVEAVLFGPQGLAQGLAAGSIVVDTSTIAADAARRFAQRLHAQGVSYLDAPISGGQQGAEAGTLACMIGGPAEAVDACREVMQSFCKTITHVGDVGAGQTVKACNQVAVAGAMLGVADAIALALAQGVDPKLMREVVLGGTGRSFALERHGQRIIDGDFQPGFRARLMRKDLRIALETARAGGAQLQGAALAEQLVGELCDSGRGELDWNVLGKLVQEKGGR